jgi:hypothetical protein
MLKKVLLGGIVGGVVVFLWGSISHMLLPLGEVGIREIPNEAAVLGVMKENVTAAGVYLYPGLGKPYDQATEEDHKQWAERYKSGGHGILVYTPGGAEFSFPASLVREFVSNMAAALVAALLLWHVGPGVGFGGRVMLTGLLGVFSTADVLFSYWNWYGFPTNFIAAGAADSIIGWTLAGAALARLVKPAQA